jgi:hypothetical protein
LRFSILHGNTDIKGNKHYYGVTQTSAYAIATNPDAIANRDFQLYGVRYGFATKERAKKINYNIAGTVELAQEDITFFYKVDAGARSSVQLLKEAKTLARKTYPSFRGSQGCRFWLRRAFCERKTLE